MIKQLFGVSPEPVEYSSEKTRYSNLEGFTGGASGDDTSTRLEVNFADGAEDLELKFRSRVNRIDNPSCYGPNRDGGKIANRYFTNQAALGSWCRKLS